MLLALGPVAAADVRGWVRFARRILVEIQLNPGDLAGIDTDDLIRQWSALIDEWAAESTESDEAMFRWSQVLDTEVAEFLLHGLERSLRSRQVQARMTPDEAQAQRPFTLHVLQSFVDGLVSEGLTHEHYADQVRAEFPGSLD